MPRTPPPLHVAVSLIPGYALVTVTGTIQLGTDQVLAAHLTRALGLADAAVIIDMAEVDFCDSAGLSVLAGAARHARANSKAIVACALSDRIRRLLRITALDQVIHTRPDIQTAIHWLEYGSDPAPADGAVGNGGSHHLTPAATWWATPRHQYRLRRHRQSPNRPTFRIPDLLSRHLTYLPDT